MTSCKNRKSPQVPNLRIKLGRRKKVEDSEDEGEKRQEERHFVKLAIKSEEDRHIEVPTNCDGLLLQEHVTAMFEGEGIYFLTSLDSAMTRSGSDSIDLI